MQNKSNTIQITLMLLDSTGSSKGSYINSHYIIDNKEKAIKEAN